jgi:hypothetical protein
MEIVQKLKFLNNSIEAVLNADNKTMTRHINFEDNLFIINIRIRMIRDLLRLDPDTGLFLEKTVDDLEFIDRTLESLMKNLNENTRLLDRELKFDNLSDIEWQFSQLLAEFTEDSSPFSPAQFPEIQDRIFRLKNTAAARRKTVNEAAVLSDHAQTEPVVSPAELNELLKGF